MEQLALGRLAEVAARLASDGNVDGLDALVAAAARKHQYSQGAIVNLISGEWARTGVTPGPVLVPRGTYARSADGR